MKKNTKNEESELETVPKRGQGLWSEPVLGLIIWGKLQLPGTQAYERVNNLHDIINPLQLIRLSCNLAQPIYQLWHINDGLLICLQ